MLTKEEQLLQLLTHNDQLLQQLLDSIKRLSTQIYPIYQLLRPTQVRVYPITTNATPNTPTEYIFKKNVIWMIIDNDLGGGADISISFDAGTTYKTFRVGKVLNLSPFTPALLSNVDRITHKSGTASVNFEILAGEFV